MSKRLNELRQQYNQTVKLMRDMHELAERENRGFTADEQSKYNEARTGLETLQARIEREQELVSQELRAAKPIDAALEGTRDDPAVQASGARNAAPTPYDRAFRQYLVGGTGSLSDEQRGLLVERRDMSLTAASGGYTVPQGFYSTLVETTKATSGFLDPGVCMMLETDAGNSIPIPLEDDTANAAAIVAEATSTTTSVDATFNSTTLGAYTYRSLVRVSLELLQDSAFDIEGYISRKLGIRLARGFNAHASTGTNSGQPQGLFNASVGAGIGHTAATGNTLKFPYVSLVQLEHSVDPSWRQNAKFMFNDVVLQGLKIELDTTNRPIWMPDYAVPNGGGQSFPARVLGYQYVINQDAPVMAANARCVAFGDFQTYFVRRVRGMMLVRADQRFIDQGQIGFYLFARMDGKYANPTATAARAPIRLGQNSAT
jgi:HK97 family phage major capsid protein